jgi:hypothetical protein
MFVEAKRIKGVVVLMGMVRHSGPPWAGLLVTISLTPVSVFPAAGE